jgi:ATP-dependent 26S proteasome regulatory subunit
MTDFDAALDQQLARNSELARQRADAEAEMDRAKQQREEDERREAQRQQEERNDRHAELAKHLDVLAKKLKSASPDQFIVRTGWTQSGEEFLVKISTRQTSPSRSLVVELDRDDDQVLARWTTDVGNSVELWRLMEVTTELLTRLVLQVADAQLWHLVDGPPAFPTSD